MPTKAEKQWMALITRLGCIVCWLFHLVFSPPIVHHMLSGGRRRGHLFTLPLCEKHHASGLNNEECVSRHPWRKEFESRYGTEEELLEKTKQMVNAMAEVS